MEPMPPKTYLTVRAGRWSYSGGVREKHRYTRQGNQLVVQRLVDSAAVRAGYGSWQDLGKLTEYSDTLLITALTASRLVARDSTTDPDSSLIRVWRYYYSR
ncbi:hypothetical protein [Hymenobacter sp. DG01]|uniref:hypothetical protein n=1 Tax=Hymenobacter sp. DG01 TaxID=2584940 RepID=UPI00112372BF|nr:hypothetical protein [Hymenobacter sp. DG01]